MFRRYVLSAMFLGLISLGSARDSYPDVAVPANANYVESVTGIDMEMVWIDPGTMIMGASQAEFAHRYYGVVDEYPVHRVMLSGFWIGSYEVTQEQWTTLRPDNPAGFSKGGRLPVENVSWDAAMEFCQELSEKTGRSYTLPTEAQWEFACRAGTATPFYTGFQLSSHQANVDHHYAYPGGNYWRRNVQRSIYAFSPELGSASRFGVPGGGIRLGRTTEVGSYPPNAWGLYDMHGNVSEWCLDYFGLYYYRHSPLQDPQGPEEEAPIRAARGGSWLNPPLGARSANRFRIPPVLRTNFLGFRIVRLP